mgnify:CR=1 FL=1
MTNKVKVRKFNSFGLSEIKLLISSNQLFDAADLTNPSWTDPCLEEEIDLDFTFNRKSELGKYLHDTLKASLDTKNEDAGLWTWLCFAYIDKLIKQDNKGKWYLNHPHYLFTSKGHKSKLTYRHMIYSAYLAYDLWGQKSDIFDASSEPHQYGDTREQFLSRNYIYQHFNLFFSTFYDSTKQGLKSGGAVTTRKDKNTGVWAKKKDGTYQGRGGLRRWIKVLDQKAKIYRLHGMKEKEIRKLTSPEF